MKGASVSGSLRHGAAVREKRRAEARRRVEWAAMLVKHQRAIEDWQFKRSTFMHSVVPLPTDEQPTGLRAMFGHFFERKS